MTCYPSRREYRGMQVDQAKRLRGFEKEIATLKRLLEHAERDTAIAREGRAGSLEGLPPA